MLPRQEDRDSPVDVLARHRVPAREVAQRLLEREADVAAFTRLQPLPRDVEEILPLAVKGLISVRGMPAPVGSPAHPGACPDDAAAVKALLAVGFTVVGQTNTPQLGMGVRTEGTHNPWNTEHIAGGSSGGSAAAVASGVVDVALGTDTGGSIRIPAALCGVVGFRPSSGTVDKRGVVPFSSTFDEVGPLTCNVAVARAVSEVLWAASGNAPAPAGGELPCAEERILGVPWTYVRTHTSTAMLHEFERALAVLESLGFRLTEVELEPNEVWADLQRVIRVPEAWAAHRALLADPRISLSPVARATLESASGISSADYRAALARRAELFERWQCVLGRVAAIVTPTTPVVAPHIHSECVDLAESGGLVDEVVGRFTRPWSTLGLPSLTLPTGRLIDGLPVGLQLAGGHGRDHFVLDLGELIERHLPTLGPSPLPLHAGHLTP